MNQHLNGSYTLHLKVLININLKMHIKEEIITLIIIFYGIINTKKNCQTI